MKTIHFVPYTQEFLHLSWQWLNDPEIKELTLTPDFTEDAQRQWFERLKLKTDYKIWGVECNHKKIGVVGLKNMEDLRAEFFGYIGEKTFWNSGIGQKMLAYAANYAVGKNVQEIWLRVAKNNFRAIKAYEKFGFRIFHQTENEYLMQFYLS